MFLSRFSALAIVLFTGGLGFAQEKIDSPEFLTWSKFKKGTSVTMKVSSDVGGMKTENTITTTLLESEADKLVLQTVVVSKFNNMEFKADPMKRDVPKQIELPKGIKKEDVQGKKPNGTKEEGTETLKIGGVEYKTKWYKVVSEANGSKIEGKSWLSDDVPGLVVKGETQFSGTVTGKSSMELIEFKKP